MGMPTGNIAQGQGGRIVGSQGLTEKQRRFVTSYVVNGAKIEPATQAAGYAARTEGYRLIRLPAIQAAIAAEVARTIASEGATLAIGFLVNLLRDEEANPKLRLDAAKTLLDRAGHIAPKAADPAAPEAKPLTQMTLTELLEAEQRLQSEINSQAQLVQDRPPVTPFLELDAQPCDQGDQPADHNPLENQ